MKKYSKKQKQQMDAVSDIAMGYSKDYKTTEEKVGEAVEEQASFLLSYLEFDEVDLVPPDSIANHKLKADLWVCLGEAYYPFQIKASETGEVKHRSLSKVSYTDSKGQKHYEPVPPCLVLNKGKKGFDFIKEVVLLFRAEGFEIMLKARYSDAFYKFNLLKGKYIPLVTIQSKKINLDSAQVSFLLKTGLITRTKQGFQF